MRVPSALADAFGEDFGRQVEDFARAQGWLPEGTTLASERFLARSVAPHVRRLSELFNRLSDDPLESYWKMGSNPANLRLAYFLAFMPPNLFRMASVWCELSRLGFRWPPSQARGALRAIELGAGPATGACGVLWGERHAPLGLPERVDWALVEQDRGALEAGRAWLAEAAERLKRPDWSARTFHRTVDWTPGRLLPPTAPRFQLWLMSFVLNETSVKPDELAESLARAWEKHLAEEGIALTVEPALREQSRRLLEVRAELLERFARKGEFQVLLPCLGHQACGALAREDDWCHEEVAWWRPPFLKKLDELTGLDRRTLPFSYLVVARSRRPIDELLPSLAGRGRHRLVSDGRILGPDSEFFICGQDGKRRCRMKQTLGKPGRGDILLDADVRGGPEASRIDSIRGFPDG